MSRAPTTRSGREASIADQLVIIEGMAILPSSAPKCFELVSSGRTCNQLLHFALGTSRAVVTKATQAPARTPTATRVILPHSHPPIHTIPTAGRTVARLGF